MTSDFVIEALTRFTYRCNEVLDCQVLWMDLVRLKSFFVVEVGDEDHVVRGVVSGLRNADFEVPLTGNNAAAAFELGLQFDGVFSAGSALGALFQLPHHDVS